MLKTPSLLCLAGYALVISSAQFARPAAAELVSISADILTTDGICQEPTISGDGRYVAFSSDAELLPTDFNPGTDVYLKDRLTGTLRLLSDSRGGDQPLISADGRVVIYRATGPFPKIRLVELRRIEPPRTVSYPYNGSGSFRYADTAAVSPDGRFVGFPFRPIPGFSNLSDTLLATVDTLLEDRLNSGNTINSQFLLNSVGQMTISRTGEQTFFETTDPILPQIDGNGAQDIYQATLDSLQVRLLSFNQSGSPQVGVSRDPVVTAAEDAMFFISDTALSSSDVDGRATIYRSTSASGFSFAEPIATSVTPVALSRQATGDGTYVTFLAKVKGNLQPYLLRVVDGTVWPLAPSALETGLPVISADNRLIAFATKARLSEDDGDNKPDVHVVQNPDTATGIAAPTVLLGSVTEGLVITEGAALNVGATATGGGIPINSTALEVDGAIFARANGAVLQRQIVLPRGTHVIRALTLNQANVPGESAALTVVVRPVGNSLRITTSGTTRTPLFDGATRLAGNLRLDSTVTTARGPFQVVLTETPSPTTWEIFGSEDRVPPGQESVLQVIDLPALPPNGLSQTNFDVTVSPAPLAGDGFQGQGFLVTARLREMIGGNWIDRDLITVAQVAPLLNEETPGPNGGIPQLSPGVNAPVFNPAVLQTLQIDGPSRVAAQGRAKFQGTAVFSNGTRPCNPQWDLVEGSGVAAISSSGELFTQSVDSEQTVTVRATFGGRTATRAVVVFPRSPKVSIRAQDGFASEAGDAGTFKVTRSSGTDTSLTVLYRVTGTATAGSDFTALQGSVTIPAGAVSTTITVNPLQDAGVFEGRETVKVTLLASGNYRLASRKTATVAIDEDEAFPAGLPDAAIELKRGERAGDLEANSSDGEAQQVTGRTKLNKALTFFCDITNRTAAPFNCEVDAGQGLLGFEVRYFFEGTEVTQAVLSGDFVINNFAPGQAVRIIVKIKPTAETPIGSLFRCPITVSGTQADLVEAAAERSK